MQRGGWRGEGKRGAGLSVPTAKRNPKDPKLTRRICDHDCRGSFFLRRLFLSVAAMAAPFYRSLSRRKSALEHLSVQVLREVVGEETTCEPPKKGERRRSQARKAGSQEGAGGGGESIQRRKGRGHTPHTHVQGSRSERDAGSDGRMRVNAEGGGEEKGSTRTDQSKNRKEKNGSKLAWQQGERAKHHNGALACACVCVEGGTGPAGSGGFHTHTRLKHKNTHTRKTRRSESFYEGSWPV